MKKNLFLACVILADSAFGQSDFFGKVIDESSTGPIAVRKIVKTSDNNFVAIGSSFSNSSSQQGWVGASIAKIDSTGSLLWNLNIGIGNTGDAYDVVATPDSGVIVVGTTLAGDSMLNCIFRLDKSGIVQWSKVDTTNNNHPFRFGYSIIPSGDGNYFVQSDPDLVLHKISPAGQQLSASYFYSCYGLWKITAVSFRGGGFASLLHRFSGWDDLVVEINAAGNMMRKYSVTCPISNFKTNYMIEGRQGGYIFTGNFNFTGDLTNPTSDSGVVIRTDEDYNVLWAKIYYMPKFNITSITEIDNGDLIISGNHNDFNLNSMILIKTNSAGAILNAVESNDILISQFVQWTGKELLVGGGLSTGTPCSMLVIKTDTAFNSFTNISNFCVHPVNIDTLPVTISFVPASIDATSTWNSNLDNFTLSMNYAGTTQDECFYTAVSEESPHNSFVIYPNPTNTTFTISLNYQSSIDIHLTIFDVTGRLVFQQTLNRKQETVNCKLSAGVYFIKVSDGEKVYAQKLIIE